jgi:UDP-N-acetylmuramoylalanine--D-glutamate ligase
MSGVFAGRHYYVYGLGRSGLPVAHALLALGAYVSVWDDSPKAREAAAAAGLHLHDPARYRHHPFMWDALVLSPGIPHRWPAPHPIAAVATAYQVPIVCDAELLYEAVRLSGSRAKFLGVTGTNGKSTTTALAAHMLAAAGLPAAAGGNLGTPALALPILPDDGVYVLEMSSYMLERLVTLRFDGAAVLNISPDHLDRHGGMDGYVAAKRAIFDRRSGRATAVIGVDDPWGAELAKSYERVFRLRSGDRDMPAEVGSANVYFNEGCIYVQDPYDDGMKSLFVYMFKELPNLPGKHNALNIAAAMALIKAPAVWQTLRGEELALESIATFPGLPHRQQRVAEVDGVLYVNDSKATNADAAARALACYERVTWIAGGVAKAGGIESLAPLFPRVARALLIGRDAPLLAETLRATGVPHEVVGTLEAAVAAARGGDAPVVLLSPACASFDQFENFEARGDRFMQLVRELR